MILICSITREEAQARWEKCPELFSVWSLKALIPKLIWSNSKHLPIQRLQDELSLLCNEALKAEWTMESQQNILNHNKKQKQVVILEQIRLDQ